MKEIWNDIIGYEGLYQISNFGNVRSLDRFFKHSRYGIGFRKGQLLNKKLGTSKYYSVHLSKNGKRKSHLIHRLEAISFIPNDDFSLDVNHKDLNKLNNNLSNLEWCTRSENCLHAIKNGHKPNNCGEKNKNSKLTKNQIMKIRKLYSNGEFLQKELAKRFNVSKSLIGSIVNYKIWKHI